MKRILLLVVKHAPTAEQCRADQRLWLGQRSSMTRRICSAQRTAFSIAMMVAGTFVPPSYCASFRAARMLAAISKTRLRPSSTVHTVTCSPCIRL
jgi:hypothetical protein